MTSWIALLTSTALAGCASSAGGSPTPSPAPKPTPAVVATASAAPTPSCACPKPVPEMRVDGAALDLANGLANNGDHEQARVRFEALLAAAPPASPRVVHIGDVRAPLAFVLFATGRKGLAEAQMTIVIRADRCYRLDPVRYAAAFYKHWVQLAKEVDKDCAVE